ncbi:hypothetical protein CNBG2070 [Cryptococcus deneoformans B-3501A]|uniref:hypothetical protein n=1 Tax=Cryptococcus deneoformans (strain B-3501A) TaxID=283643 RepID=UPI000042E3BC|nr:hypothetical protein CNBG2070 [Cryptococcus neoformans var. neoformans B-3501A]EAL19578.1 hypothetical protein CNBG2070 [Cryptococcus neoformans var. neoformans B-3501A]
MFFAALALSLLSTTWAAPGLVYPLQDQLPPVARVGSEFTFDLLPGTFNSTSSISYTTSTLPSWLSWDTPTLSFYGTPASSDQGQGVITVTATDSSGSTRSNFTLLVTNYSVPGVHQSFYTQIRQPNLHDISSATILPEGTGVSIPPWWSFSLGFQPDTFRLSNDNNNNGRLYNGAHVRGTAGLPSWLQFDNETFTFTGVAPGEGTYTVVATGTDFWGYTGAQTSFIIEVGQGESIELAKDYNFTAVQTIAKGKVDYALDLGGILVGNETATKDELNITMASDEYDWLTFNSDTNVLSGIVPDSYQNGTTSPLSIPLNIASSNSSNTLSVIAWISMDIAPYFFSTYNLPNSTISPSKGFSFDISPYRTNSSADINATVTPTDAASWLTFHTENLTLEGTAPTSPKYNQVSVVFEAVVGNLAATTTLNVNITGISDTSESTGTAAVPTSTGSNTPSHHGGLSTGGKIALGVVFGILGLLIILALLLFFCCRRRRSNKNEEEDEKGPRASAPDLGDPFRRSYGLAHTQGAPVSTIGYSDTTAVTNRSPASLSSNATAVEKPHRMDGMKGIIHWDENDEEHLAQNPDFSQDFVGYPDVIATEDPIDESRADMSSDTRSMMSKSSRASWQSKSTFQWSSGEGTGEGSRVFGSQGEDVERASLGAVGGNVRMPTADSIPRPRADFTPKYPRHQSPAMLARLTGDDASSHDSFSEFNSSYDGIRDSFQSGSNFGASSGFDENSMMGTGSVFHTQSQMHSGSGSLGFGRSTLSRIGESTGFKSSDTEAESEEPAVVSTAHRTSFDNRQDSPRILTTDRATRDSQATSGMFDDAEEASRRSMIATNTGLGYPNSVIYFGSPQPHIEGLGAELEDGKGYTSQRSSNVPSESTARASTIRAVPFRENPLSPSLPQASSFIRHRRTNTASSGSQGSARLVPGSNAGVSTGANDGRVYATSNETFSMHPAIHPPPTVSLSAATWSSNPPSTYRAEVEGGGSLPTWLHFDARELELWGVPPLRAVGETTTVRILERLPRDARRADPMSFGYEPPQEKEVGRVIIEVNDKTKSPQFAFEGSPHAL